MDDVEPSDQSKMRIVAMSMTHCERYRLLRVKTGEYDGADLTAIATEMLDLFESRIIALATAPRATTEAASPSANQRRRFDRKPSSAFPTAGERT